MPKPQLEITAAADERQTPQVRPARQKTRTHLEPLYSPASLESGVSVQRSVRRQARAQRTHRRCTSRNRPRIGSHDGCREGWLTHTWGICRSPPSQLRRTIGIASIAWIIRGLTSGVDRTLNNQEQSKRLTLSNQN